MFTFTVYEPVYNNFLVNICYYPLPLFTFSEVAAAMRDIIFRENQHGCSFLRI